MILIVKSQSLSALLELMQYSQEMEMMIMALEYLPKENEIKENDIVYTSGSDGTIPASIPVGKIIIQTIKSM